MKYIFLLSIIFGVYPIFAQKEKYIESHKFGNYLNSDYNFTNRWNKDIIKKNNVRRIEKFYINESSPINDPSEIIHFDKMTSHLIRWEGSSTSSIYQYEKGLKIGIIHYRDDSVDSTKYFYNFPEMGFIAEDSSYTKYIFNEDSILVREESYDDSNRLIAYKTLSYHHDYIISDFYYEKFKNEDFVSYKKFYHFLPDGSIMKVYFNGYNKCYDINNMIDNFSIEWRNENGFYNEILIYGKNHLYRTKFIYDDNGLLQKEISYTNDSITSQSIYKYFFW